MTTFGRTPSMNPAIQTFFSGRRRRSTRRTAMAALRLQLLVKMIMLVSALATNKNLSSPNPERSLVNDDHSEERCPPCENFFRQLERNEESGLLSQVVRMQERGEPKSGTGMMFDWATGALVRMCFHLQQLFGKRSCQVAFRLGQGSDENLQARSFNRKMTFEPALAAGDARCPCKTIERVSIVLSKVDKHTLPVNRTSCAFSHCRGIAVARGPGKDEPIQPACSFPDGTLANNNVELWRCMHAADCEITDDWLQMVVYRDPRPVVVSAYFYLGLNNKNRELGSMEEFINKHLPVVCQYMAVRHILFSGLLAHQSVEFWYRDSMANPLGWHYHFLDSVGLQLPHHIVRATAETAAANKHSFKHKEFDKHPGETNRGATGMRKFEDEVTPEVLKAADAILRVWLPPVLLEKLGVQPEG